MGSAIALSVSALCGGVLLLMAVALLMSFPRLATARRWALSWALAAGACVLAYGSPFIEGYFWGTLEQTIRTLLVLGSNLALALGFLSWFQVSPDRGQGVMIRTLLWGGSFLATVPLALGLTETSVVAWTVVALWTLVPVFLSVFLVATLGLPGARGPARAQSAGLLKVLAFGSAPFALSWVVFSAFPGIGWSVGFPPFLLLGAALTFRALVHHDTRFHHHHAAPFLLQKTQDTVLFLTVDGRIQALNPAVKVLLDVDEASLVGQPLSVLGAEDEDRRKLAPLETLTFPDWEGTLNLGRRSGESVPVHLVYRRIHNPAREAVGAVLLVYDLRLARQTDLSSREDLLTTLANRRWVLELLEAEFQRVKRYGGPLTGLWIEVAVPAADDVLRRLGAVLRAGLRKTDFCGRVGAGEFLAVLPETPPEKALVVARRLEKMFELASDGETPVTRLRIGLAGLDQDLESTDDFLARVRDSVLPAVPLG